MIKFMSYAKSARRELLFTVGSVSRELEDVSIQELEHPIETDCAHSVACLAHGFQSVTGFRIALRLLVKRFQGSDGVQILVLSKHIPHVLLCLNGEHPIRLAWLNYRDRLNDYEQACCENRASETQSALADACGAARQILAHHLGVNP